MIRPLLGDTLTVYRATYAADGRGGRTKTMASVGTIRARVMPLPRILEHRIAGRFQEEELYLVHTVYGADVQREDQLDRGDGGPRLRVLTVGNDSGRTYTRAECQLLQAANDG